MATQLRFVPGGFGFDPMRRVSHLLIVICLIISVIGFSSPMVIGYFGLHRIPVDASTLPYILGQLGLYQFLHAGWIHLAFNSYFLYQVGPDVEARMSRRAFLLFFLGNTIFVALSLWVLSTGLTIGISGFCMALLAYLYMDLQAIRHPMANNILMLLVLNIAMGLFAQISFIGHAAGAVWGVMWWYIGTRK